MGQTYTKQDDPKTPEGDIIARNISVAGQWDEMEEQGASIFVLGTSSIFRPDVDDPGAALEAIEVAVAA